MQRICSSAQKERENGHLDGRERQRAVDYCEKERSGAHTTKELNVYIYSTERIQKKERIKKNTQHKYTSVFALLLLLKPLKELDTVMLSMMIGLHRSFQRVGVHQDEWTRACWDPAPP